MQVSKMIKHSATPTDVRKNKIMELLQYFDHNSNPIVRAFGLNIGTNFIKVHMRLLPSPLVEYYQKKTLCVYRGAWRAENVNFLKGCSKGNTEYRFAIIFEKNGADYNVLHMMKESVSEYKHLSYIHKIIYIIYYIVIKIS